MPSPVQETAVLDSARGRPRSRPRPRHRQPALREEPGDRGGRVRFTIELTTPACPVKDQMRDQARAAVLQVPGVTEVEIEMTASVRSAGIPDGTRVAVPGAKNVIAVGAGKGGVGKTTVAVNLAVALAHARQPRRAARRRHLRPERAADAGSPDAVDDRRQEDPAGREVRDPGRLDGVSDQRRLGGDLARTDAARRHPAVLPRSGVGRSRLPGGRHAAGDRRCGVEPQPDRARLGRHRRDDPAAGLARRHAPGGADVPEAEHPDARPRSRT